MDQLWVFVEEEGSLIASVSYSAILYVFRRGDYGEYEPNCTVG